MNVILIGLIAVVAIDVLDRSLDYFFYEREDELNDNYRDD